MLLAAALVVYLLWFSPVFAVERVDVSGVKVLTADQVRAEAAVPLGAPLAALDTGRIAARVAGLPAVADVRVGRRFPDAVVIAVVERTAVYQRQVGGAFFWVDSDGVPFRELDHAEAGIPLAIVDGDDTRLLADVATVVAHLPAEVRPRVTLIRAHGVDDIVLALEDGGRVIWGSADQSELKAQVLRALLAVEAKVYDVSAPGHPTTK